MSCVLCTRQARGFGVCDTRYARGTPWRYPRNWVFCSRRCQAAFLRVFNAWLKDAPDPEEVFVLDLTGVERAALQACLKGFAEAAGGIGFDQPLGAYSEAEALAVCEAIVRAWSEAMVAHQEASHQGPVRGLEAYETPVARALTAQPEVNPGRRL